MKKLVAALIAASLISVPGAYARTQHIGKTGVVKDLQVTGNLTVAGTLGVTGTSSFTGAATVPDASLTRAKFATTSAQIYPIDLQAQVRNEDGTTLAAAASSGKFGVTNGTHSAPALKLVGEAANNNSKTDYCCALIKVPAEYVAGSNATINVTISRTGSGTASTNTIDVEAYELSSSGTVGSDLCATAAQATAASATTRSFTITGTGLLPGEKILVYLTGVLTETASSALNINILDINAKFDIKG